MKKCPFCAEEIQDQAVFCKHCNSSLVNPAPSKIVKAEKRQESTKDLSSKNLFIIGGGLWVLGIVMQISGLTMLGWLSTVGFIVVIIAVVVYFKEKRNNR